MNSDSIICETSTILVQRTSDNGNLFIVHHCLYVWKKVKVGQMVTSTYIVSLLVSISMDIRLQFLGSFFIKYIGN